MWGLGIFFQKIINVYTPLLGELEYAELLKAKSQIFVDDNELKGEKSNIKYNNQSNNFIHTLNILISE